MHEGPALRSGEDGRVDALAVLGARKDETSSGAAQRLVRGARHVIRVGHGIGVDAADHQSAEVGHVHHQGRADLVGDLAESREIYLPGIRAASRDDYPGLLHSRDLGDGVVVQHLGLAVQPVVDDPVEYARKVGGRAVGEVAAASQVHRHQRLAGLDGGLVDGHVGRRARVRLDVRVLAAEELPGPLDRYDLGLVDRLAAGVVPLARVTLGIFVGEHRALRLEHGWRSVVLAGYEVDLALLAAELVGD